MRYLTILYTDICILREHMEILFILWITLFPFVLLYGAFEGPKTVWFWLGGFLLTVFWTIRLFFLHPLHISRSGKWLLGWIIVLGIASIIGIHPVDSLVGASYRHQGVLFFFTLFLVAETLPQLSSRYKHILDSLLGFAVVVESVIVIEQKLFVWGDRPLGTLGESNAVAGFLAIGLWWVSGWRGIPVWLRTLLYMLTLAAIAATLSRTGIIVAAIVTIGWGFRTAAKFRRSVVWFAVLLGALIAVGIIGYVQLRVINTTRATSQYENRTLYWRLGFGEFIKRPLLGYGAETEEIIYDNAFKLQNVRLVDFMIDRSHNLFLDVALWSGIVGLTVFIGWLISLVRKMLLRNHSMRLLTFFAWIVFAFVQPLGVVHWIQLILLTREDGL